VCYFRWRTARHGTEQHWYGVLDANGRVGRRYRELAELGRELAGLGDVFVDATPVRGAALLHEYDSRFALEVQPTNRALAYVETAQRHYEALRSLGIGVDVVAPSADLSPYKLVAAPNLYVVDEALADGLRMYVEGGGTLVVAPRAGVKDRDNVVPEQPLPAWLRELAGVELVEIASLLDDGGALFTGIDGIKTGTFEGWYEQIEPVGAHVVALYEDGDFAETPAITANTVGAGRVFYLAGAADLATLKAVYGTIAPEAGLPATVLPDGVESVELQRNGETFVVLLNHTDEERTVALTESRRELLAGIDHEEQIQLPPFGVAVLVSARAPVETA